MCLAKPSTAVTVSIKDVALLPLPLTLCREKWACHKRLGIAMTLYEGEPCAEYKSKHYNDKYSRKGVNKLCTASSLHFLGE